MKEVNQTIISIPQSGTEIPSGNRYGNIDQELGVKFLRQMILIRRFEEKAAELYSKSFIRGFLHLYIGEEAVAVGTMNALDSNDNVLCTYREHGQALVRGVSAESIMAEMYGKIEGCCKGRGGSMHLFDKEKKFYGGNAIVGGHLPMAVGFALTQKMLNSDSITACFFGEGAAAEGEFHESMNLAALWKVPLLFVCENNLYAMGTALHYSHVIKELEIKGVGYGVMSEAVDGMDAAAVYTAAQEAVQYVRTNKQPYFLVCNTYRFRAHSMFDAELYRDKGEVEEWKKRDPITLFEKFLIDKMLISKTDIEAIKKEIQEVIERAVAFADAGLLEPVGNLCDDVYKQSGQ